MAERQPIMTTTVQTQLPDTELVYFNVRKAINAIDPNAFVQLPYASRVLAENLLRQSNQHPDHGVIDDALRALIANSHDVDFPYFPARVILQDLLGTPALVDLAGLRDAVADAGGDPGKVNPVVPTQLVVDHSLNVEFAGSSPNSMVKNMAVEQKKNAERFEFLSWAKLAFDNLDVLMPGSGILHQINIECMSPVVQVKNGVAYPDTLVGTDSHTTMIDALGVLGWGVGGLEAESVMLGRPIWMRLPRLVRVTLTGEVPSGILATDIVLTLTEYLRKQSVVGCILEFNGPGMASLSLADRATVANMAPEFGATAAMFPIDERTLDYLRLTGREAAQIALVEKYAKAQGLWASDFENAKYDDQIEFNLSQIARSLAGPSNPHQRIDLTALQKQGIAKIDADLGADGKIPDGAVVIAAITSCTNTSNPRSLIAAGLLARRAVERGLKSRPWVKTSFAPGSKAVQLYLESSGLMAPLRALGFDIVGFGCTSCNGMSGPLDPEIQREIQNRNLRTTAVLSGNRNFDGRIHPYVKEAYLASPALVVAYAIAGSMRIDVEQSALAHDERGRPVRLLDLWPSDQEIDAVLDEHVLAAQFVSVYKPMFLKESESARRHTHVQFDWRLDSSYIQRPPYWEPEYCTAGIFHGLRPLALLGDNITTDHISPSGAILSESAAGEFLLAHGVPADDFNSYGTRRGNHVVAVRATFANNRLRNEMVEGREGSFARLEPEGTIGRLFDVAKRYMARQQGLVIIAGKNYGSGSSRDWAAKGVRLLGVRVVICENFERIHRSNLVGMGVLPLEFSFGVTRKTLGLDGTECFDIEGMDRAPAVGATMTLRINRKNGVQDVTPVRCCIYTEEERQTFAAGGLLPRMASEFLDIQKN